MNVFKIIFNLLRFDRANWKAVVLCIFAAMIFWVFNSLNKEYSTSLRFPILFEFNSDRYLPADHFPKSVTLNVTGVGWDLFRRKLGLKVPNLIIPLERPAEVRKIVAGTLIPIFASQVNNLRINSVATDTLYLKIDKRDSHRYKLKADISAVTFREGYGRTSPVVILPDSVKIEGPESRLHAVIDSILLKVESQNVSENFREEVEISLEGSEFVKRDPPVAQVMFEVGRVQVINKKLKVVSDLPLPLTSDSVMAQFQIPVNRVDEFKSQMREITARVNSKFLKGRRFAAPKVSNLPTYSLLLHIDSVRLRAH